MDLINKIKSILFEPKKFFPKLQKEKGIKTAFKYLAILGLFSAILTYIMSITFAPVQTGLLEQYVGEELALEAGNIEIIDAVLNYVSILISSFIVAGILHLWLKLFKSKEKRYEKTYQLYVYATTPTMLLSWIPILGGFAWIYDLILLVTGTMVIHKITKTKSIWAYVIPLIIMIILGIIIFALIAKFMADYGQVLA